MESAEAVVALRCSAFSDQEANQKIPRTAAAANVIEYINKKFPTNQNNSPKYFLKKMVSEFFENDSMLTIVNMPEIGLDFARIAYNKALTWTKRKWTNVDKI
ncbi:hypothetical protein UCD39_16010 [Nitrospirillum sp. BR 11752]|uniref:hypothetical protein n=1 Tax=Nitrospirillum sp. BR 11752 TaxID=3104293 RepID=UPI002EC5C7F2|nr:hypothetical protein [Nitrospirillum sp. BR 11752]